MIRYAHTNIIAADWRGLAAFYERVFGCIRLAPERALGGAWLAQATGVENARLAGVHLRLPGHGAQGPTLEIFSYASDLADVGEPAAQRRGLRHLAFEVDDVEGMRQQVLAAGGRDLGATVSHEIAQAGTITFVYVTDPEGNIIELQSWQR